jgi:hypothetical protein
MNAMFFLEVISERVILDGMGLVVLLAGSISPVKLDSSILRSTD